MAPHEKKFVLTPFWLGLALVGLGLLGVVAFGAIRSLVAPDAVLRYETDTALRQAAKQVVDAFYAEDASGLASIVHPVKGVRFSRDSQVNSSDVVLSSKQITNDGWVQTYDWGAARGTTRSIKMTLQIYAIYYVKDTDLSHASVRVGGNHANPAVDNAATIYREGVSVEYFTRLKEPTRATNADWVAQRLVFEKYRGSWKLVGLIRDEGTD